MMTDKEYKAYVVDETKSRFTGRIKTCRTRDLPAGDLLIQVKYSSLNYKDALSASGNRGVTKNYPHTPGIDASGVIAESASGDFSVGDEVLVTGWDFGMNTAGGFGEYIRVPAAWAIRIPEGLSMKEVMILGTAGLTAGMSVYKLSRIVSPDDGLIAVSGATGGVGSMSLSILAAAGYRAAAITGKPEQEAYLRSLGAAEIILRSSLLSAGSRPLLKEVFAGGIDTTGGSVLENILKSVGSLGAVTCCGNAASDKLEMTVYPFILRGVSLIGIDSQKCPVQLREIIWSKLAQDWRPARLMEIYEEISLEELPARISMMLSGRMTGRVLIRHS